MYRERNTAVTSYYNQTTIDQAASKPSVGALMYCTCSTTKYLVIWSWNCTRTHRFV